MLEERILFFGVPLAGMLLMILMPSRLWLLVLGIVPLVALGTILVLDWIERQYPNFDDGPFGFVGRAWFGLMFSCIFSGFGARLVTLRMQTNGSARLKTLWVDALCAVGLFVLTISALNMVLS